LTTIRDEDRDINEPWTWLQDEDVQNFGDVILDYDEQVRWSRALFLGGLSWMYRYARVCRELIFQKLDLKPGEKVLLFGECIDGAGFLSQCEELVGPDGEVVVIDCLPHARKTFFANEKGKDGQRGSWKYDYLGDIDDEYFDTVGVIQGVQHNDSWNETAGDYLRVMKSGRNIVFSEIAFGPRINTRIEADLHIEYLWRKIWSRWGADYQEAPYHSNDEVAAAITPYCDDVDVFDWRGLELCWGTKK
jgi:hypothetical protein